jgi:pyrroloquinoline quinone biosynthesis protein E
MIRAGQSVGSTVSWRYRVPQWHKPLGLLAELTHRCPLGCPYCSNPLALDAREDELDTATWVRVFREAAQLGVLQVAFVGRRARRAARSR